MEYGNGFACGWSLWKSKRRVQTVNKFNDVGSCRFARGKNHDSWGLTERCLFYSRRYQVAFGCMAIWTQSEPMRRRENSKEEQKILLLRERVLEIPEVITQNMLTLYSILGKKMMHFKCFGLTTLLPDQ